jgi:uncharacterized membrane protein
MELPILILLHVTFAIVWGGGAIVAGFFLIPSMNEAGPASGAVMAGMIQRRFPMLMTVSGLIVILTGIRLYTMQVSAAWIATPRGIVLTLGALAGLGAFLIGVIAQKPTAERLGKLAAAVGAAGKPPTPEQAAEMQALRTRLAKVARVTGWHMLAAVLLMAANRLAAIM